MANEPLFSCIFLGASRRVAAPCMVNLVLLVQASFLCESLCVIIVVCLGALPLLAIVVLVFALSCLFLDPAKRLQLLVMLLCCDVSLSLKSLLAA